MFDRTQNFGFTRLLHWLSILIQRREITSMVRGAFYAVYDIHNHCMVRAYFTLVLFLRNIIGNPAYSTRICRYLENLVTRAGICTFYGVPLDPLEIPKTSFGNIFNREWY